MSQPEIMKPLANYGRVSQAPTGRIKGRSKPTVRPLTRTPHWPQNHSSLHLIVPPFLLGLRILDVLTTTALNPVETVTPP